MRLILRAAVLGGAALGWACGKEQPPPLYQAVPVGRRDIVVSAQAAGTVEPILVVDVKSKASGEIMEITAETGDIVQQGELMVRVDPREPQNVLAQAQADLEVARASLSNSEAAKRRADEMFAAQVLSEQEHELANLQYANARAQLVRAERAVQVARDQLDDTNVRAPITGTIIQKNVERGQVIASATREVSGGTVLLRMADLTEIQVRTLVDETDIGKVQPLMRATITVDAYPNRPFEGRVLKIEPQSVVQQNVTMFPVLIRIPNVQGLLRPGMSSEVEIHIGQRQAVLAIPNAALRTNRDVASAAQVLGLDPEGVTRTLAALDSQARQAPQPATLAAEGQAGAEPRRAAATAREAAAGPGGSVEVASSDRASGAAGRSSASDRTRTWRQQGQQPVRPPAAAAQPASTSAASRRRFGSGSDFQFGGSYIVFVLRQGRPEPARVRTGITDLDYSEVVSGLAESDTVLLLPSASLIQSQQEMRERFNRITGGGGLPGLRQQQPSPPAQAQPQGGPR
jgi:HlyD family secretion protein